MRTQQINDKTIIVNGHNSGYKRQKTKCAHTEEGTNDKVTCDHKLQNNNHEWSQ